MGSVTLRPSAAVSSDWTSGTYADIDEVTADDDTSYIVAAVTTGATSVSGTKTFICDIENSSGRSEAITDVTVYVRGKYSEGGNVSVTSHGHWHCGVASGGTNYFCGTEHHDSSYTDKSYSLGATNPADSQAWAWSDIDALRIALEAYYVYWTDGAKTYYYCGTRITQAYVVVTYTDFDAPTCSTQAASSVSYATATGNGTITHDGNTTPSAWGICVCLASHSESPDTSDSVFAGSGAGTEAVFTASITGLSEGTAYHARAYVTNSVGTAYGATVDFTTGTQGWANIKNVRMGTGVVIATDVAHICMGTGKIDVADISDFNGVAV
jgi:hypothetical protein